MLFSIKTRGARCRCSFQVASLPSLRTSLNRFDTRARLVTNQRAGGDPTVLSSPRAKSSVVKRPRPVLRYVYFQFDGIGNDANSHRQVGNLFDVKLRAINKPARSGSGDCSRNPRWSNGINNDQVGSIIRFALDNPKKIAFLSFQPVSFTGRDEEITAQRRLQTAIHAFTPGARRQRSGRHY